MGWKFSWTKSLSWIQKASKNSQTVIVEIRPISNKGGNGKARGVTDEDLGWLNSKWTTPKDAAQLSIDVDRVMTF